MADITSAGSGNFSDGATWVGGVVPGVNDVAIVATGHTVAIDGNVTCQELRKEGSDGGHTGNFVLGGEHNITADITNACTSSGGSALLNFTLNSGTATIVGNVTAGDGRGHSGIEGAGTGTLQVVGNVTGGDRDAIGIGLSGATAVLTVAGDVTGGYFSAAYGVAMFGASAQATVTGNLTGGSSTTCIGVIMTGTSAQLTVTGNATGGGHPSSEGVRMTGASAQLTMTGNVFGGSFGPGVLMIGTSSNADITGDIIASPTAHGLNSMGFSVLDGDFIDAPNGRASMSVVLRRVRISTNVRTIYTTPEVSNADGSPVVRASLDYVTNNVPVPADVREGTVYADNQFTGTLAVPPVTAVGAGVPVDDTEGTAVLSYDVVGALFQAFGSASTSEPDPET